MKGIFDEYLKTRKRCKEGVKGITFEKLKEVILKQVEKTKKRYGCREVDYKVSVKDGKAKDRDCSSKEEQVASRRTTASPRTSTLTVATSTPLSAEP